MKATVTEPRAPAMLMKSVKVLTTMQRSVVKMMIRARRVNFFTTAMLCDSVSLMVNLSMMAKAAKI